MTLISDTLYYRADGTVSGVTRVVRESYKTPSGRDVTEDVTSAVDIAVVTDALDAAYAAFDQHNKTLEQKIADERRRAEDEIAVLRTQHTEAITAKNALITERDATITDLSAQCNALREELTLLKTPAAE